MKRPSEHTPIARIDVHIYTHPHTAVWVAFIAALMIGWYFGGG